MSSDTGRSEADEPLIGNAEHVDVYPGPQSLEHEPLSFRSAGKIVRFLTLSAGISGLLFGFDTGVISSTLVSIGSDLSNRPLTTPDKSLVTAITSLLALISAPATGVLADKYGRRSLIFSSALLFVFGALIQAFAQYVWTMVLGRALVGAAVGLASGAVPLYITELAPAELRGRLVTIQALFITGGQVVAYSIGFLFASFPQGWRWMVGVGAVPAIVQLVLLIWMPETPRWLVQVGLEQRARAVLAKVYSTCPEEQKETIVENVFAGIKEEMQAESKLHQDDDVNTNTRDFRYAPKELFGVPANRRALAIACLLQAIQQLCGFNSLMYFSATIFALVGFTSPIGTSLSIALTNFIFTLVAFTYIDKVGRRNILLRSIPLMVLGLLACSIAFQFIHLDEARSAGVFDEKLGLWPIVLLLSMIIYVAAYAVGIGCVPWQQSELFGLRVRSFGSGLATAANWSSNFIIGVTFLPMMAYLGPSITFAMYAVICILGWVSIHRIYPETAGLELEGISELLKNGWGVEESITRFRDWRTMQEDIHNDDTP